jgi:hypothetical protein
MGAIVQVLGNFILSGYLLFISSVCSENKTDSNYTQKYFSDHLINKFPTLTQRHL